MITPASTFPDRTASSIPENFISTLFFASGKASENKKFAVVYFPGIAIERFGIKDLGLRISDLEISNGPTPKPKALPEFNKIYLSVKYARSEEHTSELQSPDHLVCRL